MRKYTEKIHGARLLKMMEKDDPCACCPAAPYFDSYLNSYTMWCNPSASSACDICKEFVQLDLMYSQCPCDEFGKQEAIKRTWIALEEKGYLK